MKPFFLFCFVFISIQCISQAPFSGKVFYDLNANQVLDAGDSVPAKGQIIVNAVYPNTTQDSLYKNVAVNNGFFNGFVSDNYFFILYLNGVDFYNYDYASPIYTYINSADTTRFEIALKKRNYPPVPFKGRVYFDNNYNARYDAGDMPAKNIVVTLANRMDYLRYTTKTDSSGQYYMIADAVKDYYINISGVSDLYIQPLSKGLTDSNIVNFPLVKKSAAKALIHGTVYYDIDLNGNLTDTDSTVNASAVTATNNRTLVKTTVSTDANGWYELNVDTGSYTIKFTGIFDSVRYARPAAVSAKYLAGNTSPYELGFAVQEKPGVFVTVKGFAYYDNNNNGFYESENIYTGAVVIATNKRTGTVTSAACDYNGNYQLKIDTGSYSIILRDNYSHEYYLPPQPVNIVYPASNFPYQLYLPIRPQPELPVHITGRMFYDNNQNNQFDGNDSAVVNGRVYVIKSGGYIYDSAVTNAAGYYYIRKDLGSYNIRLPIQFYNTTDYDTYAGTSRNYQFAVNDTINFALQKKDSVTGFYSNIQTDDYSEITAAGGSKIYQLNWGFTGALASMPVMLSVDYNPALHITASVAPSMANAGHLQWNIANLAGNTENTIALTVNFPVTGDTIDAYILHHELVPGITVTNVAPKYESDINELIQHSYNATSIGASKSVKWIRTFTGVPYETEDRSYSIDTAQTGDQYFMVGYRRALPSNGLMVAKLNKDGLSVWEKYLRVLLPAVQVYDGAIVKHTSDGGCIITGHAFDSTAPENQGDLLIAKFDTNGSLSWYKLIGGTKDDGNWFENDILEMPGGYLFTATVRSYDGQLASNHSDTLNTNVLVAKLNTSGAVIWQKHYGGSRHDKAFKLLALQNGDALILGTTQSEDGDITGSHHHQFEAAMQGYYTSQGVYVQQPDSLFAEEAWVINIDANGKKLWDRCYGGTKGSIILGVAETSDGFLLSGSTNSKDGDLEPYSEQMIPLWLLQVSRSGVIKTQKTFKLYNGYQTSNYLESYFNGGYNAGLHKTKDGNYITALSVKDKYGEIKSAHGGTDIVLVKLNPSGNIIWQKPVGGTGNDDVYDIQVDRNDNILFAGSTGSENDDLYEPLNNANYIMLAGKAGITNSISGKVYIDKNGNYLQDAGEPLFNEGTILTYKTNDSTSAHIFSGRYLNNVDTGMYVTKYVSANNYYTPYPSQQSTTFNTFDQQAVINIALLPKPGIKDLQTWLTAQTASRPGFGAGFRIITKNVGTETLSGIIVKLIKPATVSYLNSTRAASLVAADTITFLPINLAAGVGDTLDINLKLASPPTLNIGDTLTLTGIALPQASDTTPENNMATLRQLVKGSFDPNNKTEAHAGIYTAAMKATAEPFQYTIHFQNTGSDTAFFVTVKDTLDNRVDISTLETFSASHPYTFSIEGNVATWQFNRIKLADSASNNAASTGYISFTIKPKAVLKIGDSIINKAAIYFDFNLPVVTNENLLVLVADQSVMCPGGNTQLPAGKTGTAYQWQISTGGQFVNLGGNAVYSGTTTSTLQINNAPSGLYGTQYRCVITQPGGSKINGNTYQLSFANTWTGAISTAWETAGNWSCGSVPDANTDVLVKSTSMRQPEVNSITAVCRSINAIKNSHVWIKAGARLDVKGK